MSLNNPFHSVPAGKPEKKEEDIHIPGTVDSVYAKDYYPAMVNLEEKIAAGEEMLPSTKNPDLVGRMLRRDRLSLIALKEEHGVPLTEKEKALKKTSEMPEKKAA